MVVEHMAQILILEAFYGGSHKQLVDVLVKHLNETEYDLLTIPAKKWHWCARMSALQFAGRIPINHQYRTVFCSSVLNLAELVGMRPDLSSCRKIVYFHENQLCYPVREIKQRDVQYGINQITTCLCADTVLFNSRYNKESFLDSIQTFLNVVPNMNFKGVRDKIAPKCEVLYFPIEFEMLSTRSVANGSDEGVEYLRTLAAGDVVLSTALHEFYGVAM
uniref:tRNA-queuosine alpha-mannosyltransferase n=1 Tax=Anopheles farauti TaxID=69004 RepID=A0A182QDU7_9DIPT